jgi:predicted DNA-binding transcriptional regulator YafY
MAAQKYKPQQRRLAFIDLEIRRGKHPNCTSLARVWEVSAKTIQRDLDYLRDTLQAPIEYDPNKHGYLYTERTWKMPAVDLHESDLFAIFIAEQALEQYAGTPIYQRLLGVFDRIRESLPSTVIADPALLSDSVTFQPHPVPRVSTEVWDAVMCALRKGRRLRIRYRIVHNGAITVRTVDPLRLVSREGEWYLLAWDRSKKAVRTFAMARFGEAEVLADSRTIPEGLDDASMVRDGFGGYWGTETHAVRIRFSPAAAPLVEERSWHQSQQIERKPDGSIVLSMKTSHLSGVKRWLLSWGSAAKALEPQELADDIAAELQKAVRMYKRGIGRA